MSDMFVSALTATTGTTTTISGNNIQTWGDGSSTLPLTFGNGITSSNVEFIITSKNVSGYDPIPYQSIDWKEIQEFQEWKRLRSLEAIEGNQRQLAGGPERQISFED